LEELHGEDIAEFVFGVAGVAFEPFEIDFVGLTERYEGVPEVGVGNDLVAVTLPAGTLPCEGPALVHGVGEIL